MTPEMRRADDRRVSRERNWIILVGALLVVAMAIGSARIVAASGQAKAAADSADASASRVEVGVDELVAFVHVIQAQPDQGAAVIAQVLSILCATSDPVTVAKCAEYGIGGPP